MFIERDNTAKPTGRRLRADEAEEASTCLLLQFACRADKRDRLEHMFTLDARHFCAPAYGDLRAGEQPIDEIARHAALDLRTPDRHRHIAAAGREEERRLACAVPSADHRDRAVRTRASLELGGG